MAPGSHLPMLQDMGVPHPCTYVHGGGEKGENTDDVGRDREGIGEERIEALLDPNT